MKCNCGGKLGLRSEKLKSAAISTAAFAVLGLILATPSGWVGLLLGAATPNTAKMIKIKAQAMMLDRSGTYLECRSCGRQVGFMEALGSLLQ